MSLTIREKDHWKERINRRIDRAIESLYAENDPLFRYRIGVAARTRALESLDIAAERRQVDEIEAERNSLEKMSDTRWQQMAETVNPREADRDSVYACRRVVEAAIEARAELHEKQLLNADPLGRQIAQLLHEKDELLDTVWLATSSTQIKQLWSRVATLLKDEMTPFQREALAIEAVVDDS